MVKSNPDARMTEENRKIINQRRKLSLEEQLCWFKMVASRTAYKHKAALRGNYIDFFRVKLREYDQFHRTGDRVNAEKAIKNGLHALNNGLANGIFDRNARNSGLGRWSIYWKEHAAERPKAIKEAKKQGCAVSKRVGLGKLPENWQEQISGCLQNIHLDILSSSGCRPVELSTITITCNLDSTLTFTIQGAKIKVSGHACGQSTGQEERTFTRQIGDSPALQRIAQAVISGPIIPLNRKEMDSLRKRLSRKSRKLFPKVPAISFYSYRHQMASDLKKNGYAQEKIAQILGHQSTKTQKSYGRSGSGASGGIGVKEVSASSNVRTSNRPLPKKSLGKSSTPRM